MTTPSAAATAWVQDALGTSDGLTFQPLVGGWTSDMYIVRTSSGAEAVLRQMTREPWRTHARELLAREAATQRLLVGSGVSAPLSLAVDLTGEHASEPSSLMTRLSGDLLLDDAGDAMLASLATTLAVIHRQRPTELDRPRRFQSWAGPAKRTCPAWSQQPDLWAQAFLLLERAEPDYRGVFLHRDYHLGNVLWSSDGRVTGVVDWVETSWGPADLDVAHCQTNLAMLHGTEPALAFASAYRDEAGVSSSDVDGRTYWQVMDIVGFLPSPRKVAEPWRDKGRADVTDSVAEQRLEEWLAVVLADRGVGSRDT